MDWKDKLSLLQCIALDLQSSPEVLSYSFSSLCAPQCYVNLMRKCWDKNLEKRPSL
ncbi:hypothetical protein C2G38_2201966 [Gigaspora rosea]|uniref:Serine-threonine/tyrosine-protein kinase catalytic domain-containing protein n=1 Tax=Gigaspora rosea TaxID=44941 RepID=A0A397URJ9_9GLOM|nr:hypothetical protein C2G38_2201966 [Gigaspora rosea]